ncbi:MAG TPA: hypothetical protein VFS25_24780 [Chitinophaga sp.]|uniref:hypothetical protein n=1 Tax=Chitinophaga sp. TaxID=1869181 RepID=UPI002DB6C756|nr:hypothetical protein [Chitinophaga sp.]HEU4556086.1 hypothetical protein [Chitinophaga sp.]
MRTFLTFLACSGFIIWAHSCDKRILGVNATPIAWETETAKPSAVPASTGYQQQYLKELFSAAALSVAGSHPQLYLVSFRYLSHRNYLSPGADTLLTRLQARYHFVTRRQ